VLVGEAWLPKDPDGERPLLHEERGDPAAEREAMHVVKLADFLQQRSEAGLLVHLAGGGLQRALAQFHPAGEDLPEPAPNWPAS
jgi:hypothetical protein